MNLLKLKEKKEQLEKNFKQVEIQLYQLMGAVAIIDEQIKEVEKEKGKEDIVEEIKDKK